jgi:integrase
MAYTLTTKAGRGKLEPRGKPYKKRAAPRIFLCYRRLSNAAGSWSVEANGKLTRFALADDLEDANGFGVMSHWQAHEHALKLARGAEAGGKLLTLAAAHKAYTADLSARGGGKGNSSTLLLHLDEAMQARTVASFTDEQEFQRWQTGLLASGLKVASVHRVAKNFRAMLNLAARNDKRITNAAVWKAGLRPIKVKGEASRPPRENYFLPPGTIVAIVRACADQGDANFAALIATLAGTGTRESQALRLRPQDILDADPSRPRLLLWCSNKGANRDPEQRAISITPRLAATLRARAVARGPSRPLLDHVWTLGKQFRAALKSLDLDPTLTPYVLRHSSIIRQLLAGTPTRIVAHDHDTSVAELERTYARYLDSATDDLTRRALLADDPVPAGGKVLELVRGGKGS